MYHCTCISCVLYRIGTGYALLFNPVRDDDTEDVEREFDCHKLSARRVGCCFGGPDWGNGVQDPGPNTIENASAKHPICILRGAL